MAPIIWNSSGDTDGNSGPNWLGGAVPIAGDVATYDGTSVVNCAFTANLTCDGINATAAYSGDLDLGPGDFVLGSDGLVLDHSGAFDRGSGTIGITAGPYDDLHVAGTHTNGISVVTLNGACDLISKKQHAFYRVVIPAGATVTIPAGSSDPESENFIDITGTLSISSGKTMRADGACDVTLNDGASVEGLGTWQFASPASGHGIITKHANSTVTCGLWSISKPASGCVFAAGTYRPTAFKVFNAGAGNWEWALSAGTYTLSALELNPTGTGNLTINLASNNSTVLVEGDFTVDIDSSGDVILDASSNAMVVQGDIIDEITGGGTFTADSQALTLTGTSEQNVDPCGGTWGAVEVNKASGRLNLTGALACDSFTHTSGIIYPNQQTVTTTGNCDWVSGASFYINGTNEMSNCSWIIGGNFTADGQSLYSASTWVLSVTGTAVASGVGDVEYCDASGGTEINASAGPWTDRENNSNWNFGAGVFPWFTNRTMDGLVGDLSGGMRG